MRHPPRGPALREPPLNRRAPGTQRWVCLLAETHHANRVVDGIVLPDRGVGGSALEHHQPLHAAHAELLNRAGDAAGAAWAYEQGIALTASAVERAELERRPGALR
jgi:hypothetical protein